MCQTELNVSLTQFTSIELSNETIFGQYTYLLVQILRQMNLIISSEENNLTPCIAIPFGLIEILFCIDLILLINYAISCISIEIHTD